MDLQPIEILQQIFDYLSFIDATRSSRSCKRFYFVYKNNEYRKQQSDFIQKSLREYTFSNFINESIRNGYVDTVKWFVTKALVNFEEQEIDWDVITWNAAWHGHKQIIEWISEKQPTDWNAVRVYAESGGQKEIVEWCMKKAVCYKNKVRNPCHMTWRSYNYTYSTNSCIDTYLMKNFINHDSQHNSVRKWLTEVTGRHLYYLYKYCINTFSRILYHLTK